MDSADSRVYSRVLRAVEGLVERPERAAVASASVGRDRKCKRLGRAPREQEIQMGIPRAPGVPAADGTVSARALS